MSLVTPKDSPFVPGIRMEPTPRLAMAEAKYLTDEPPSTAVGYLVHGIERAGAIAQAVRLEFSLPYVDEITVATILRATEAAMEEQRRRRVIGLRLMR